MIRHLDCMKIPGDLQIEFGIKTKEHASHCGYRQHTNEPRPIMRASRLAEELKNRKAISCTSDYIAPMTTRTVDFWFESGSTYSYPAAMRLTPLAKAAGIAVRWRPFMLGPIFRDQGWDISVQLIPGQGPQYVAGPGAYLSCAEFCSSYGPILSAKHALRRAGRAD